MAIRKWRQVAQFEGDPLPGVSVLVKLAGTEVLATLYDDSAGSIPKVNPFINDPTYGSMTFYAEEGLVDIFSTKVGYTLEPLYNELIGASALLTNGPFTIDSAVGQSILTIANAIPAGAKDVGVFVENGIAFGTSQNMTGYDVGDGTLQNKWGDNIPVTLDNVTQQQDFEGDVSGIYATASSVILTARNGFFDGTGRAIVTVKYRIDGP